MTAPTLEPTLPHAVASRRRSTRWIDTPQQSEWVPVALLALGCLLTGFAISSSWLHLAYRLPRMHAVIDTAVGLASLLLAYLMYGRMQALHRQRDYGLAFAFGLSGLVNLFAAVAQGVSAKPLGPFAVWTPTIGRVVVAMLFAAAALVPDARIERPARVARVMLVVLTAFVALLAVVGVFSSALPWSNELANSPTDASKPLFVGPAALIGAQVVILLAYAAAAVGFSRRRRTEGELMTWLASACILYSLGHLNYVTFPSIFSDWIYVGDLLRLAGVMLLLAGATREIRGYWTRSAALDERRRLAHDLHDGVAQELAFIAAVADRLDKHSHSVESRRLLDAAQQALDESRLVIATLAGAGDPRQQLSLTASDAARRYGLDVELDVAGAQYLPPRLVEPLQRIMREAINNAGRHADATHVCVSLHVDDAVELTVADDGRGFDGETTAGGYGLVSMRERAEAAGGTLLVSTVPGTGATIKARLPW